MLEQIVTGLSKTVIFGAKEASKGIVTAKAELNPQFLKQQAGALAKFELMKKAYTKANGAGVASIDMQANQMFAQWKAEQDEQNAMAEEMMKQFTTPKPEVKTYTQEEVQAMLAKLQQEKDSQAV